MSSLNRASLIGNLGRDPEVRSTQAGAKIVQLQIATSETWKDRQTGERRERTEWHRVVIFNEGLGGVAEQYLKKGSKVFIEGQLQTRKWQDSAGVDRYSTEIVLQQYGGQLLLLGDSRGGGAGDPRNAPPREDDGRGYGAASAGSAAGAGRTGGGRPDLDDEIPF